jgi:hypothetical protein
MSQLLSGNLFSFSMKQVKFKKLFPKIDKREQDTSHKSSVSGVIFANKKRVK